MEAEEHSGALGRGGESGGRGEGATTGRDPFRQPDPGPLRPRFGAELPRLSAIRLTHSARKRLLSTRRAPGLVLGSGR